MSDSSSTASAPAALPPQAEIVQMIFGAVVSRAVYAVAELGIPDQLSDGPRTAEEIARAVSAHGPSVYRLLRTTAALGLFVEDDDKRFSLAPLGAALQSGAAGHARSTARAIGGPLFWRAWSEFLHSVKTGENAMEKVFGESVFDYLSKQPELGSLFNESMIGIHGGEPPAVAAAYDFSGIRKLVDVGGGTGNLLTTILLANPGLRGVLFDAPAVAAEARRAVADKGLADRCEIAQGSFFESVPAGGDAYVLSHIIHDWSEDKCLVILENCRRAMQPGGRVLLVEMVIPPGNNLHPGKLLDLMMLAMTPGGLERTAEEYAALLAKARFRLTRVVPTHSPVSVVEAVPA